MTSGRPTAPAFRAQVLVHLLQRGLLVLDPSDEASALRSLLTERDGWTDIAGVSPWIIHVRGGATGDALSEALTELKVATESAGSDWGAAVLRRRGYDVEDSYALMPLRTFTRILRGEAPPPARPPRPVAGIAG